MDFHGCVEKNCGSRSTFVLAALPEAFPFMILNSLIAFPEFIPSPFYIDSLSVILSPFHFPLPPKSIRFTGSLFSPHQARSFVIIKSKKWIFLGHATTTTTTAITTNNLGHTKHLPPVGINRSTICYCYSNAPIRKLRPKDNLQNVIQNLSPQFNIINHLLMPQYQLRPKGWRDFRFPNFDLFIL